MNIWVIPLFLLVVEVLTSRNLFWFSFVRFMYKNIVKSQRDVASSVKCLSL